MGELRLENSIVDDRYLAERCLGRGSYAEIFLAYDRERNNGTVIIKALNTSLQGTPDYELERTLVENFQNEAIALDKVRHSHIIRRLGHGTAADLEGVMFHYLLLEYMAGGDLLELCRKRRFGIPDTLFYFKQVAEALAYAHSQNVIHRDIKPNNLLLNADHTIIKVADFGVAKMALDDNTEITRVGTNVYAPPEHHPDSPSTQLYERLTPSADIYSLAKTIYTSMTGRAPRQFSRHPITELPPEIMAEPWGDHLLLILNKATASRASDRYQSIQEFWDNFARLERYTIEEEATDPEATIVRSRLKGTSQVERAAAVPHFQTLATAPYESGGVQKARIVVELPEREHQVSPADPQISPHVAAPNGHPAYAQNEVAPRGELSPKGAAVLPTKRVSGNEESERSVFDDLRAIIGSDWLRRIFIIFLIAALVGLVASTYYYFADRNRRPSTINAPQYRDGVIANALNVNLRKDPGGLVLVPLPAGTRVRVYENQNGWLRIKILEWAGGAPTDNYDSGWIDGRYVDYD